MNLRQIILVAMAAIVASCSRVPDGGASRSCLSLDKPARVVSWAPDGKAAVVVSEAGGSADVTIVDWPSLDSTRVASNVSIVHQVAGFDQGGRPFWIEVSSQLDAKLVLRSSDGALEELALAHPRYLGIWFTAAGPFVWTWVPAELSGSGEVSLLSRASLVEDRINDGEAVAQETDGAMTAWVDTAGTRWITTQQTSDVGDLDVRVSSDGGDLSRFSLAGAHDLSLQPGGATVVYTSDLRVHGIADLGLGDDRVLTENDYLSAALSVQGVLGGLAPVDGGFDRACFEMIGSLE